MTRQGAYQGPALFSHGFRLFFLAGAIYTGATVLLWLGIYRGEAMIPAAIAPRDWHIHEMLYGYTAAIVAGFLLTAVPNWTGGLPLQGRPLALLFSLWMAGRIAMGVSEAIGWIAAAAIDSAFLLVLAMAVAREIVAGRKWNNLKVVGLVGLLAAANIAFHLECHFRGTADYAARAGIALIVTLIGLIGGRVIPSFTRNWLARRSVGRMPVPFNRFDALTMAASSVAMAAWVAVPGGRAAATLLALGGAFHLVRLARWAGERTCPDPLVLVLHLAYAFVPIGFFLGAAAAVGLLPASAGIHAWAAAIAAMTLAIMTRASLGHTGRALSASPSTVAIYLAVFVAGLGRICAALEPNLSSVLLPVAAAAWAIAFLGFAVVYAPMLCMPRR